MKTIVYARFGSPSVLHLAEAARPVPAESEILIRVRASSVSSSDAAFRSGNPFMARIAAGGWKPRRQVLGDALAGEVEAVGAKVTRFKRGDRLFGSVGPGLGAHAQYVVVSEEAALARMPDAMTFPEGAGLADGGLVAMPFLRDTGRIQAGQSVLINGASGAIGSIAVQLARHFGAEVTAVTSGANIDLLRSLGANHVVDYGRSDFSAATAAYDLIFDAVGKSSFGRARRALKPGGVYVTTVPTIRVMAHMLRGNLFGGRRAAFAATGLRKAAIKAVDLALLAGLYTSGALRVVVDHTYPFEGFIEAHTRVDTGRKRGVVVLAS